MAKNYSEIYSAVYDKKNKMDFSNSMIRGNGIPLDITEVYNSLNAAIVYAASNPVAYEGQLLAVTENGDTNVYVIGPKSQGTVTIEGAAVNNYLKLVGKETDLSNYYTKTEIESLISSAGHLKREVVTTLPAPAEADANTIYMIKKSANSQLTGDYYEEYMLIDGVFELIGDTYVDLSDYVTKDELPEDKNTTYNLKAVAAEGKANLTLSDNDETTDDDIVAIKGGDNVTVSVNENKEIVIAAVDSTYTAGDGLSSDAGTFNVLVDGKAIVLEPESEEENANTVISLKLSEDTADEGYLSVTQNGLQISGINKAISDAIDEYKTTVPADKDTTYTLSGNDVTITLTPSEGQATTATLNVYNKEEVNNLLNAKANQATTYTKNEVDGLLNNKANSSEVYTKTQVYTKSETDTKIDEKIASVTGGESAADVKLSLESYRNAINVEIWGQEAANWSGTDAEGKPTYNPQYGNDSRLDKLEAVGAQANVIESITIEGTPLEIKNKAVDLPLATAAKAGLVKSSSAENNIAVATDGTMSVNSVNVNKLVQTTGEVLILNCGGAVI